MVVSARRRAPGRECSLGRGEGDGEGEETDVRWALARAGDFIYIFRPLLALASAVVDAAAWVRAGAPRCSSGLQKGEGEIEFVRFRIGAGMSSSVSLSLASLARFRRFHAAPLCLGAGALAAVVDGCMPCLELDEATTPFAAGLAVSACPNLAAL